MTVPNSKIEAAFHREMLGVYDAALKRCKYRATRFRQMVAERGGLQAARDLLRSQQHAEGLTELWQCGCLDISMEALVLREPWSALFDEEERATARRRLSELGYMAEVPRT